MYRSGGRNKSSQSSGNRKHQFDQERGPRNSRNRNPKFQNRDREKTEAGVTIRDGKGTISEEKLNTRLPCMATNTKQK